MSNDKPKRSLSRDPERGKLAGVCAGIARHFDLEVWLVRVIAVTCLVFFTAPTFIAYIVAWLVLDKRRDEIWMVSGGDHSYQPKVREVWRAGGSAHDTLNDLENSASKLERQLRAMEAYVTSQRFHLDREFSKLKP